MGTETRATIYLCRRDAHVISTAPLFKAPATEQPPPAVNEVPSVGVVAEKKSMQGFVGTTAPSKEEAKRGGGRKKVTDVAKEDLDAGLGLLDHIVETADDNLQVGRRPPPAISLHFLVISGILMPRFRRTKSSASRRKSTKTTR